MLTDKISVSQPDEDQPEDIFASSLTTLFPDDTRNQHGDAGATITYQSARFGEVTLAVADPTGEDHRKLFAHYLWNASIWLADAVSEAGTDEASPWNAHGESVLELGAGVGLCGIMACFAGARQCTISDYPAFELLENIRHNVDRNIGRIKGCVTPSVEAHVWGTLHDDFALHHRAGFTCVIAADCLWMPWEHESLARSIKFFMAPGPQSRALVVAGFHTGRSKVAPFFETIRDHKLTVESIEEVDTEGRKRPWASVRDGGREDVTERKRWLVVGVLRHAAL